MSKFLEKHPLPWRCVSSEELIWIDCSELADPDDVAEWPNRAKTHLIDANNVPIIWARDMFTFSDELAEFLTVGLARAMVPPPATCFVVVGEGETLGIFATEDAAHNRIKDLYANGYFGSLSVSEDGWS